MCRLFLLISKGVERCFLVAMSVLTLLQQKVKHFQFPSNFNFLFTHQLPKRSEFEEIRSRLDFKTVLPRNICLDRCWRWRQPFNVKCGSIWHAKKYPPTNIIREESLIQSSDVLVHPMNLGNPTMLLHCGLSPSVGKLIGPRKLFCPSKILAGGLLMLTKIRYLFIKVCVLMLSRLREILTGKDLHFV